MKKNWKNLVIIPLLLAVVAAPVCAQDNAGAGAGSNPPAVTSPPTPAAPPSNDQTTTNVPDRHKNKAKDDSESTPVRIDATGIHVGGKDPVDITIPGVSASQTPSVSDWVPPGARSGIPFGVVLISVTAITMPFIFLIAVICCGTYFNYRRNRILHETVRAMVEKGVPIPPELIMPPAERRSQKVQNDLRSGLIMLGIGIGIVMFLGKMGYIVVFIGVAFLITWLVEKKQTPKDGSSNK